MEFYIKYTETYSDIYRVEAASLNEAVDKLDEDIRNGCISGPNLCDESCYTEVSHEK